MLMKSAKLAGLFQIFSKTPPLIMSVAVNPDSAVADVKHMEVANSLIYLLPVPARQLERKRQ